MSQKVRKEIVDLIAAGIESEFLKEDGIPQSNRLQIKLLIEDKATTILEKYEEYISPKFWYGVLQSVVGSFLWLSLLAILGIILAMANPNVWSLIIDSIAEKLKTIL